MNRRVLAPGQCLRDEFIYHHPDSGVGRSKMALWLMSINRVRDVRVVVLSDNLIDSGSDGPLAAGWRSVPCA